MNKKFAVILILVMLFVLSSCRGKEKIYMVTYIPEDKDSASVVDIYREFLLAQGHSYDITVYFYLSDLCFEMYKVQNIEIGDGDTSVILSAVNDEGGLTWRVSLSDTVITSGLRTDGYIGGLTIDNPNLSLSGYIFGIGKEKFDMEEGKEYVLTYVAYFPGSRIEASAANGFLGWENMEDEGKADFIRGFTASYVITVKLSGE